MTVTRRQTASGVYNQASAAGSTSLTAAWPSATQAGSLLVAVVGFNLVSAGSTTWVAPTGWAQAGRIDNASNAGIAVYAITGAASRSGNETFQITSASRDSTLTLIEYTSTATLLSSAAGTGATGNSTAPATSALAPDTSGSIVRIAAIANRNVTTQSAPTNSFVQVAQPQSPNSSTGTVVNTGAYELIQASSSAATACAVTLGTARPWAAVEVIWRETASTETRPKRWNGSAWTTPTSGPKTWNGTAWV